MVPYRFITWLLAVLATVVPLRSGHAHAILEDSVPAVGSTIKAGKLDLRFRFNSRIDQARSRLVLTRPDNTKATVAIALSNPPDSINARLDVMPGAYVVRWQVLGIDGHITRGDVPFTATAP